MSKALFIIILLIVLLFFLFGSNGQDWTADALLNNLSEPMLKRQAHLQPGLYIAEINDGGYLGQVLYTLKRKA